jgi:hypothetical protein
MFVRIELGPRESRPEEFHHPAKDVAREQEKPDSNQQKQREKSPNAYA